MLDSKALSHSYKLSYSEGCSEISNRLFPGILVDLAAYLSLPSPPVLLYQPQHCIVVNCVTLSSAYIVLSINMHFTQILGKSSRIS